MKVLLVINSLGVGGAERVVTDIARGLVQVGHQVIVAVISDTSPKVSTPRGIEVHVLGNGIPVLGYVRAAVLLRRLCNDWRPDIVNSHLTRSNFLLRLTRPFAAVPKAINSIHRARVHSAISRIFYRASARLTDIVTNVSQEGVSQCIADKVAPAANLIAMHNGIDTNVFHLSNSARSRLRLELGLNIESQMILAVGSMWDNQKDYPNLFRAFSLLMRDSRFTGTTLVIAGDGRMRRQLESSTARMGLSENVRFLGLRNDVPDLMSACDVFALSSESEGFGLVVAEAMACQKIVVATDCGGVKEVVGSSGFVVPPRNSDLLADALMQALLIPKSEAVSLGASARERILQLYSLPDAVARWVSLYESLVTR